MCVFHHKSTLGACGKRHNTMYDMQSWRHKYLLYMEGVGGHGASRFSPLVVFCVGWSRTRVRTGTQTARRTDRFRMQPRLDEACTGTMYDDGAPSDLCAMDKAGFRHSVLRSNNAQRNTQRSTLVYCERPNLSTVIIKEEKGICIFFKYAAEQSRRRRRRR